MYAYVGQLNLVMNLDFGFISEFATRVALILSQDLDPFIQDITVMVSKPVIDWFLLGLRIGVLWQTIFDIKITS